MITPMARGLLIFITGTVAYFVGGVGDFAFAAKPPSSRSLEAELSRQQAQLERLQDKACRVSSSELCRYLEDVELFANEIRGDIGDFEENVGSAPAAEVLEAKLQRLSKELASVESEQKTMPQR